MLKILKNIRNSIFVLIFFNPSVIAKEYKDVSIMEKENSCLIKKNILNYS